MKKFWIFLGGVFTGMILTFIILVTIGTCQSSTSQPEDVVYFEKPSDIVKERAFKVFQVLDKGVALVRSESDPDLELYLGPVYLLVDENKYFSDDEVITLDDNEVARKVGIYNYQTKNDMDKTVSIIKIITK